MTRRTAGSILIAAFLLSGCAAPLWGQEVAGAQISGFISDPSGAAVPMAAITATQIDRGLFRKTVSGPTGTYVLPNLPVGSYRLEVQAAGFETYIQTGIDLRVSNSIGINVMLHVGQVSEQVVVSSRSNTVQTQSTSVSQVIDQTNIMDLPLNGRQATQLILLAGAATETPPGSVLTSKNYFSSTVISVAGGQGNGTSYVMDGGVHNDPFSNVNLPFPFPDALQEFSVQTNSLSARYGQHPGAVVNVVTKSGGNAIHGDLFEFVRNGAFNARDFFAVAQDSLKRNQFGGTIGGPLRKDQLFGFFGHQSTRIRTAPPTTLAFVPTQAVLAGDFSALESAACQSTHKARTIINPATGQPFSNGFVPPSMFNQQALGFLKYVPVSSDPCGSVRYAIPQPQTEPQYIGRVDWNQSAKNTVFGRYFVSSYKLPPSFNNNLLLTTVPGVDERSQAAVLGETFSFSPTVLNSVRATYTRLSITRGPSRDMISPPDVGVNMTAGMPHFSNLSVSGYFNIGCGTCAPSRFTNNSRQLTDDFDWIRGRHHLSFGVNWIHMQLAYDNSNQANGQFSFTGTFSSDALLDFMLGSPNSLTQSNTRGADGRQNYIGAYATDNFQINRRLNMEVGLRWEPYFPSHDTQQRGQAHFDAAAFARGEKSTVYVNAPLGMFFKGDPGMPRGFTFNKVGNFAPRVGLAWDPDGASRQAVRAGFGVFYDSPMIFYYLTSGIDAPWGSSVTIAPAGLTNPYQGYPGGNPFPQPAPPAKNQAFPSFGAYYNWPLQSFPTYMMQWNLSYERHVPGNWLVSGTYIGNKTTHIWTSREGNPAVYIPGVCGGSPCSSTKNTNQRRALYLLSPISGSLISTISQFDQGSNAEYNALLLKAEHRFSSHYSVVTNYTFSHCISEGDFQSTIQNPYNRNAERSNCAFDVRHLFNASVVADMPRLSNRRIDKVLGNWRLAPIVSVRSGKWFSPMTGVDNSLTGVGLDRPNVVAGSPYVRNTSTRQWLSPSAFTPNAAGTFGNAGKNSLVGPGYLNIDVALTRQFDITERQRFQLRFEFFNALNHVNFSNPNSTLSNSTFGVILSDFSPRILQMAAKYTF